MKSNYSRGFTLMEFLVVVGAIAILLALAVPAFTAAVERAKAIKDMSNLRQIATATQLYMNDNSNVFPGSTTATWMLQLEQNRKYLSVWKILESPFDNRSTSESGDATTAISYGINAKVYSGGVAISADKITKPTVFIVFAPAQRSTATVSFLGVGNSSAPGVTLTGNNNSVTSTPGGAATGGTNNKRRNIGAVFADWHVENMAWSGTGPAFINTASTATDPDGAYRWSP